MDFFIGQESLTIIQWVMRAMVGFFFLVFISKLMGQRSISQLRFMDFVMALLIGNIMAHPLSDEELGLTGSMVTMGVLTALYLIGVFLTLKWRPLRRVVDPSPLTLIKQGEIHYKNLKRARLTVENLLTELRKEKIEDIKKVALALWEAGGTISIFPETKYQPLTPSDMGIPSKQFDLPRIIIKEGRINHEELRLLGRNEEWLLLQIRRENVSPHDILLATVNQQGQVKICLFR